MVGIISQLIEKRGKILFVQRNGACYAVVQKIVNTAAFGKSLIEQINKGCVGCHGPVPGIAPDFMIEIAACPVV